MYGDGVAVGEGARIAIRAKGDGLADAVNSGGKIAGELSAIIIINLKVKVESVGGDAEVASNLLL